MYKHRKTIRQTIRATAGIAAALFVSACNLVQYRPLATIDKIDLQSGYRLQSNLSARAGDKTYVILMLSGGGTRAAALGYGVLEELNKQKVWVDGKQGTMLDNIDLVFGVSGGSVLAAYFSLHGKDTIPSFERRFLKQNFQRQMTKQVFSLANIPRLASPEYGRGDLLQEQFESTLFGKATFGDLEKHRKGPFAVISATDMAISRRFDFTQEYFDPMCLSLSDLRIARAVAASSAVPLVFAPITLNNNGGNCNYRLPQEAATAGGTPANPHMQQSKTRREIANNYRAYADSKKRPYIHLLDGGLTDNLGLRGLLDIADAYHESVLYRRATEETGLEKIVIINVNAQNQVDTSIDRSAAVPGIREVIDAVADIPIAQHSQESLRRMRMFADQWNANARAYNQESGIYFISLNLRDLPESPLRNRALNTPTSFYLPAEDINNLKHAAHVLLRQSPEYGRLLKVLSSKPADFWITDDQAAAAQSRNSAPPAASAPEEAAP